MGSIYRISFNLTNNVDRTAISLMGKKDENGNPGIEHETSPLRKTWDFIFDISGSIEY